MRQIPRNLPPRPQAFVADALHRSWEWACRVGTLGPDTVAGRRFGAFGAGAAIAFPPGPVIGHRWIRIGAATLVGPHVSLAAGMPDEDLRPVAGWVIRVGARCNIGRGTSIAGRAAVDIEDDVTFAPDVFVTDHNHTYADLDTPIGRQWPTAAPVRIGAGSWLGTGAVVLAGADIGQHVVVAAGSIVLGTVPDRCVIAGAPARVVRRYIDGRGWDPPIEPGEAAPQGWPSSPPGVPSPIAPA